MDAEISQFKKVEKSKKFSAVKLDESFEDTKDEIDESQINAIKLKYRAPLSTWILKPGENSNRGCGIGVYQTLNEIKSIVGSKGNSADKTIII